MFIVRKILVRKHERALLFKNGDFERFLLPGIHWAVDPLKRLTVEQFNIAQPLFEHRLTDFFLKEFADDVARLFTVIETGADEVATVFENGRFAGVIGPERRALYWKGIVDVTAEVVNIGAEFEVAPRIAKALVADVTKNRLKIDANAVFVREVPDAHVGVLYVNGKLVRELEPGLHVFWKVNRGIAVNIFDKRPDQSYRTGGIVDVAKPASVVMTGGKWNTFDITARGTKLTVILNGMKMVDVDDKKFARGPIALQYGAGTVRFRNVRIRTL